MASIAQTQGTQQAGQSASAGGLFGAGFLGGAIAAVVNVVLFFVAGAAGVALEGMWQPGTPVAPMPIAPVILASIVPAIPASLVALALGKFAPAKAGLIFAIISAVLTLLSLGGPFGVQGLGTSGALVLVVMHVVAGGAIGFFLSRKLSSSKA